MAIKIPKDYFYQILLALCVAAPSFHNFKVTFAIWTLAAMVTLQRKYSTKVLILFSFFAAIFVISFFSGLFESFDTYFFFRDMTYMAKPILGILVGYQLSKGYLKNPLIAIVYAGLALASYHILDAAISTLYYSISDINTLRYFAGFFSDYEVYVLVLLMFPKAFELPFSRRTRLWFIIIISISLVLYFARTNYIQLVLLVVAMKGYFEINKRSLIVTGTILGLIFASYAAIVAYNPRRNAAGLEAFLYKVKIAPQEAFKTKIDIHDWQEFHDHYRSYENIQTIKQVPRDGMKPLWFGKGLGSTVDLKTKVELQGEKLRFIPYMHNCFMTTFLKSGIVGLFFLILSIFYFFVVVKSQDKRTSTLQRIFVGTGLFLILSNWVFMGLFFPSESKSILIGVLFFMLEKWHFKGNYQRNTKIITQIDS
jgi:hypothetical protein